MADLRTIKVQGQALVKADCNEATIDAAVRNTQPSVAEASQIVTACSRDLHSKLKTVNGVQPAVTTTNIQVHAEYQYHPDGSKGPPQYAVQQGLSVKLRQADGEVVAAVIDAMVQAAGDNLQLNSVTFSASDEVEQKLIATARKLAAEDAAAKAKLYAEALGTSLGRIVTISEAPDQGPQPWPPPGMPRARTAAEAGAFAAPVSMGDKDVTASIWVTYTLQDSS